MSDIYEKFRFEIARPGEPTKDGLVFSEEVLKKIAAWRKDVPVRTGFGGPEIGKARVRLYAGNLVADVTLTGFEIEFESEIEGS